MNFVKQYITSRNDLLNAYKVEAVSKFIHTNGPVEKVHYLESGSGEPLILLHGGGSHSGEWIPILNELSQHYKVLVVDRPGCGLTDRMNYRNTHLPSHAVQFLNSFREALELEKVTIAAHSMGGYFAICFALAYPEKFKKLLLIGAPAGMNRWTPYLVRMLGTKGLNKLLLKTIAKPSPENVKFIHKKLLVAKPGKLTGEYLRCIYFSQRLRGAETGFLSLLENALDLRGWKPDLYIGNRLGELKVPVRFIWGDKDVFENPESGRAKASAIPDVKFKVIEQAGHKLWLDQPEKCIPMAVSLLQD